MSENQIDALMGVVSAEAPTAAEGGAVTVPTPPNESAHAIETTPTMGAGVDQYAAGGANAITDAERRAQTTPGEAETP